jgi:uncharacterized membrane protein
MDNPLRTRPGEDWPNMRQASVLVFGGALMAIGGCAGFLVTFENRLPVFQVVGYTLATVFVLSVLCILVGLGFGLIVFVRFMAATSRTKK